METLSQTLMGWTRWDGEGPTRTPVRVDKTANPPELLGFRRKKARECGLLTIRRMVELRTVADIRQGRRTARFLAGGFRGTVVVTDTVPLKAGIVNRLDSINDSREELRSRDL